MCRKLPPHVEHVAEAFTTVRVFTNLTCPGDFLSKNKGTPLSNGHVVRPGPVLEPKWRTCDAHAKGVN